VAVAWDPTQYERFKVERAAPFFDLLALVLPSESLRVLDLGCGTGELSCEAHRRLRALNTLGIDSSQAMLERARRHEAPGVAFELADMVGFSAPRSFDIVLSNAALQWVPDHASGLARWTSFLTEKGQLAVQVPANLDHPSHSIAAEVATEEPFLSAFGGDPPADPVRNVLAPEEYARLLFELGYKNQHVRLQVYGHVLRSTEEVVEWVRGTSLTRFAARLRPELFEEYVLRYKARALERLGRHSPFFYPFKRILLWGQL